jgi:putative phage-type endonuclease
MSSESTLVPVSQDRRHFLGGSDIGCLFGVNPWKSAYDLWEEKTAETFIAPQIEPKRQKLFRRGKKLEPWIIELLEEEQGLFIQKRNQRYVDEQYPFMECEVDFEFMHEVGLCNGEAKTVSPFAVAEWGEEGSDEIPLSYCLQAMWGLGIKKDRPVCLVAPLIGADDLRVYWVKRDEDLIAEMRARAVYFWIKHVQPKIPPPAQTISDTHKILYKYGGFPVENDPEIMASLQKLRAAKEQLKEAEEEKKSHELEIKRRLIVLAEAHGLTDTPKKFVINNEIGKRTASLSYEHRSGYTVEPTDFWILRT